MFRGLREEIKALNADVKTIASCERAQKLKKKLLSIGLPIAIIGLVGVITNFVLFATAIGVSFGSARMIVPFILFPVCGIIFGVGIVISSLGFRIVVTHYTADLIDEAVGNKCDKCGATITPEQVFCPKCGEKVKKECPACKHVNSPKNDYCEKCGEKLD